MVVGAFPVAKLGALVLKQVSKPIANAVKEQAKTSPIFRKYVCLPPAQFYNWCEEKAKMWVLNLGKPVSVPVYNEKMAIELGANLLGEGIIFIFAAGILIAEYTRSSIKEAAKEEAKLKEMSELKSSLKELFIQAEEQAAYIRELRRRVGELDTKIGQQSLTNKKKKDDNPPPSPPPETDNKVISKIFEGEIENAIDVNINLTINQNESYSNEGLILQAVNNIENEFWNYPLEERKPGILMKAINHLYENVYRFETHTFV